MIRQILLQLLILIPFIGYGQNYKSVQQGVIRYFTNPDNYLRAVRVDSVKAFNGDTILYPFKTARGDAYGNNKPVLTKSGSWMGDKVIVKQDGTNCFINYRGDTITINTQAALGDSWILYSDTGGYYYVAQVTGIDTMSIHGTVDSVKTITMTAMHIFTIVTNNRLNNMKVILSKEHGFVQSVDWYVFPQQKSHDLTFDYFTYKARSIEFRISDFYSPKKSEVYDYIVGDVFQKEGFLDPRYLRSYFQDSIMQKTNSSGLAEYTIRNVEVNIQNYPPYGVQNVVIDTVILVVDNTPLLDTSLLPEEWGKGRFIFYNANDTMFCNVGKYYSDPLNYIYYGNDTAEVNTFEPCGGPNYSYKTGLGAINYSHCFDPTGGSRYWMMKYVNKSGNPCGNRYYMSVNDAASEPVKVSISPNPSSKQVTIDANAFSQIIRLELYDITGKLLLKNDVKGWSSTQIDVADYNNGTYLLRLYFEDGQQYNHKLLVQH